MSAEQLALQQLSLSQWQLWITGAAILLGPLAGVVFTLWFQGRKEKRDAKNRLFLALMAHRKLRPPTFDLVNGLNLIDAVFARHPSVVRLWHEYYDLLCHSPVNDHLAEAKYLDLLSDMAKALGYTSLSQTDIARFYSPIAHGSQAQLNNEIQLELLQFLRTFNRPPQINQQ
jgi:hypothetical protein